MSGYQEIITDPSYASQIVAFTFPHIGNVGVNPADIETSNTTKPSRARHYCPRARKRSVKFRAQDHLSDWLAAQQIIGISGVDTRAITTRIRDHGMFNAVLAHAPDGQFDEAALAAELKDFAGLEGPTLQAVSPARKIMPGHKAVGIGRRALARNRTPSCRRA